ncbi:MAG: CmpA/NrtA family ABC transporter substrate-binding protein [Pseudomonadales bacterium]
MSVMLPPPEKDCLDLGFVRLTDSAPLVVARELGLFEKYRLDVTLSREVSWANVRDKLAVGALDAAPMPAPLPAMTTLGASGIRVPMLSGLTLSLNGNTITLAAPLWHEVRMRCAGQLDAPSTARALGAVLRARGGNQPTLAVVHAFSTHMILLRAWLRTGGIDPDRDVRTIIVPPAQMADSLAAGVIDGYCVGEPWGSVAVRQGTGAIAALGCEVWAGAPEKVLCVTQSWHDRHPASHLRLRLALMEACGWLSQLDNRVRAADLLADAAWLDLPPEWLLPSLIGELKREPGAEPVQVPDFLVFDPALAGFPWRSQAERLVDRCCELLGRPVDPAQRAALVQQTARPDLFRECARVLGMPAPVSDRLADTDASGVQPGVHIQ